MYHIYNICILYMKLYLNINNFIEILTDRKV